MSRRVVLSAAAHAAIEAICLAETDELETGGILLGHQHTDGHLSVTVAGDPGPRAEKGRRSFRRDPDHARTLARNRYARDRSVWIGDWHTHPHGPGYPSSTDLRAYADILNDLDGNFDAFLALVVVPATPRPLLFPWVVTKHAATPAEIWIPRS